MRLSVGLAAAVIRQADGARLDRDAALALEVHVVEQLRLHLALIHGAAQLDEPVGQRGLAVVDVCDDRKIADVFLWDHREISSSAASARSAAVRTSCTSTRSASSCSGVHVGLGARPSRKSALTP